MMSSKLPYVDKIRSLSPDPEIGSFADILIDSLRSLPEKDRDEILANHIRMMETIREIDSSMDKILEQASKAAQTIVDKTEMNNKSLSSLEKETENNG